MYGYLIYRVFTIAFVSLHIVLINFAFNLVTEYFYFIPGYQSLVVSPYTSILFGVVAIIPSFFLPIKRNNPSIIILWIVYFVHILPSITLFHKLVDVPLANGLAWTSLISILFVFVIIINRSISIKLPVLKISYHAFSIGLIAISIFSIIIMIKVFGFTFSFPSFESVYGVRTEYKEQVTFISGYVATIGGFAISPILILFAIKYFRYNVIRSIMMLFLALLLSFIIYANSGFKSVALTGIVALLGYMIFKKVNNVGFFLAAFIPSVILINFLLAWVFGVEIFFYHWIRRVFLVPGMITSYYYEFIIPSGIYHLNNAPSIISKTYFGTDGSANAGIIGDGIAKFRYIGILLNMLLFVIILKISDSVSRHGNYAISGAVFLIQAYAIANSSLTTVMVTYGYLIVIICLYLSQSAVRRLDLYENRYKKILVRY